MSLLLAWHLAAATAAQAQEGQPKPPKAATKKKVKLKAGASPHRFGVGVGLFNFYPPQPSIEAGWRYKRFAAGLEVGAFNITVGEFTGSTNYTGLNGRYLLGDAFFAGLSVGKRRIEVTTEAAMVVNGQPFPIKWTRVADQTVVAPKAGFEAFGDRGSALVFSFGALVPVATTFTISRNVDTVPGLPNDELAAEQESKANDVKAITNATLPYIELKYFYYF